MTADEEGSGGLTIVIPRIASVKRGAFACVAVLILSAFSAQPIRAAADKEMKVGFVDVDLVIRRSNYISGQVKSIEAQGREYQDKIDRNMGRYDRLVAQYNEQESVLTDEEAKARRDSLEQMQSETKDLEYKYDKLLSDLQEKTLGPTTRQITSIIKQIGEKEGYDLILTGESVLFAGKQMDLTQRVIERLDKEAPKEASATTSGTAKTDGAKTTRAKATDTKKKDTGKTTPTEKTAPSGERKPSVEGIY